MKKMYSRKILILGASGTLGSHLYRELRGSHMSVTGTTRTKRKGLLTLDVLDTRMVRRFPWKKFGTIIDCTGRIEYTNSGASMRRNMEQNVFAPLGILRQLGRGQRYLYCSTHAVLSSREFRNPYVLSKMGFEELSRLSSVSEAETIILRLPAFFDESRGNGLMYRIREAVIHHKPLTLTIELHAWHAMYTPRIARVIAALAVKRRLSPLIVIGYPQETDIRTILSAAAKKEGKPRVRIRSMRTDHYKPRISKNIHVGRGAFAADLATFFKTV